MFEDGALLDVQFEIRSSVSQFGPRLQRAVKNNAVRRHRIDELDAVAVD